MSPEDENAEVLDRMAAGGDDLSMSRPIDFNLVFVDEPSARAFASAAKQQGFETSVEETGCIPELPWDVTATRDMKPTVESITEAERLLDALAVSFGGRADGWGCLAIN